MNTILMPVGLGLGLTFQGDAGGEPTDRFTVRVGSSFIELSPSEYDLWWQCRFRPKRDDLSEWMINERINNPSARLEKLISSRVLAAITRGSLESFARRFRVSACGCGGGVDAGRFILSSFDTSPLLAVDEYTFLAWSVSDGSPIDQVAEFVASRLKCGLADAIRRVAVALPELISCGLIMLDEVLDYVDEP